MELQATRDSIKTEFSQKNNNAGNRNIDENEPRTGGIKEFIAQTTMIGNVIAAAASQKNSSEPLPFTDYSLFEETYDAEKLRIHINPHSATKYVFIPNKKIEVQVTAERKHGPHIFHPYIYTMKFTHDKYAWEVTRSYKDIKDVHKTLAKIVKADLGRSCSDLSKDTIKPDWPEFPTEHDHLVTASQIDDRCKKLAEYLRRVLTYPPYRDHEEMLQLLGVSSLSFVSGLSQSLIEDALHKRSGDNVYYGRLSQLKICCDKLKIIHLKRWFIIKDTYIVYLNVEKNNSVGFLMLVDNGFKMKMGIKAGAYHGIEIKNLQRSLVLKCRSSQQQSDWFNKINTILQGSARDFYVENSIKAFAPSRKEQKCRWYINGAGYMEAVMQGLYNAREEIYITDWWLCPELFLKRPTDDLQFRLDKILLKKAKEGVRVYILLFKEVEFALGLLSSRAKAILTQSGKNTNIRVLRHPEHTPSGVFLWSHHEKCVIIDQSVAFMGGIDLCFGRWDNDMHRLIDLGRKENITEIEKLQIEQVEDQQSQLKTMINDLNVNDALDDMTKSVDQAARHLRALPSDTNNEQPSHTLDPQRKSDLLLVAALMGTQLNRQSKARKKNLSLNPQSLANPTATHMTNVSPVFVSDNMSTNNFNLAERLSNRGEKTKSTSTKTDASSMRTDDPEGGAVFVSFKPTSSSNQNNPNSSSNNFNQNNNKNSKINKRNIGSTKASKSNSDDESGRKLPLSQRLKINANKRLSRFKASFNDLSVPTEVQDLDAIDDTSASKKQIVKRKWNQIKRTVKRRSRQNPLNRFTRRKSMDSNYEQESDGSEESDGEAYKFMEDNIEKPIVSNEGYYWIGKDYSNTYVADFKEIAKFSDDQFDRAETPRMPWRDEALVVFGDSARDLARHFIQRWNQCKREKVSQIDSYPFLLPKSYTEPYNYNYADWFKEPLFNCEVQMTRSLDIWSGGISQTENSILNAYCELIRKAEYYIYIENQFFVTTTDPEKDMDVKNRIGLELVNRIKEAHKKQQKFRVYIVLPLLPGFDSFNAIQAVQYYNLRSINLGEYSIYKELKNASIEPTDYITFHGMRNWSVLMGKLVQEIIYVHSKLMIVDDKYVICGSANINDRSLLGKRDSEIAAVIKDEEFVYSKLNNVKVQVGKYAFSLRQKIFKLHLGIYFENPDRIDVNDCVCDSFYQYFRKVSNDNTRFYDEVFKCLPSDNVLNFEILKNYPSQECLKKSDPAEGKEVLEKGVKGFIVDFPLMFLSQERRFFPELNTPEGMVPIVMWT